MQTIVSNQNKLSNERERGGGDSKPLGKDRFTGSEVTEAVLGKHRKEESQGLKFRERQKRLHFDV